MADASQPSLLDQLRAKAEAVRAHDAAARRPVEVREAVFHVEPSVQASVLFEPDYERQVIDVALCNVDRFETVRLAFQPDRVDVAALEDLVRLMLGEPNGFLHRAPLALIGAQRDEAREAPPTQRA